MCPKKNLFYYKKFELSKLMNFNPNRKKKSNLVTCPILHRRPSPVIALDHVGVLLGAGYLGLGVDLGVELDPPPQHGTGRLF